MESTLSIIISIVLSTLAGIISGAVLFFVKRFFKKKELMEHQRYENRVKENMLILKSIDVIGKLTVANSIALRDHKTNGTMSNALNEYEEVSAELYAYLLEVNARNNME